VREKGVAACAIRKRQALWRAKTTRGGAADGRGARPRRGQGAEVLAGECRSAPGVCSARFLGPVNLHRAARRSDSGELL